ncbi:MAG: efflux RND transporter periplasmic adaptor subunit [Spirochaetes bacterium]|nr:efflux RND transporter periplasmic adaptor subunit [Spirochaetota bacterium]
MKGKTGIKVFIFLFLLAVVSGGTYTVLNSKETKKIGYETQVVRRGTIEEMVSSTGTIQAKGSVEVLTQLTGTIESVYVDFNDRVRKGQLLAELDKSMLLLSLREQEATLRKAKAKAEEAQATYDKNLQLQKRNLLSEADLLSSKTTLESAKADLESAQVAYEKARLNLEQYAKILSPINGIVLERNIDKGQTVVANSGSVTRLFTLAENLENLEIYAQVDEIDIGKIREGQDVRFTVEAFPDRKFTGKVRQIRKMPTTSNNIVNYTVVIDSKNPDNLLLPGLTATVEFFVNRKENVWMIPNAALKFSPPADVAAIVRRKQFEERIAHLPKEEKERLLKQYDEAVKKGSTGRPNSQVGVLGGMPFVPGAGRPPARSSSGGSSGSGVMQNRNTMGAGAQGASSGEARFEGKPIWILQEDGTVSLRYVRTGITDGKFTEVVDGESLEGLQVIVRMKQ